VEMAVTARADAVKFQTFRAENLVSADAPKAQYQMRGSDSAETQFQMLKRLELTQEAQQKVALHCETRGIVFLSTPFDRDSASFLNELGVPAFKIGSGDITDLPLLAHIARFRKPVILSTGMSALSDIEAALTTLSSEGCSEIALLHCVSSYPAEPSDINLRAMHTLASAFGVPVGYSDHTEGLPVALAATALGASILEKHITLDRGLPGPDQFCSVEPDELKALVSGVRDIEAALGHGRKEAVASESNVAAVARKSLVAARDIPVGSALTEECIAVRRPGTGLPPAMLQYVLGRTAKVPIAAGSLIRWDALQ
jgi:N,N'-diacetyllegionaminate synthase